MMKVCKKHGICKHYVRKDRGKDRTHCSKCNYESVYKRRKALKKKLVDLFGGKCTECGYSKCLRALSFHHLDPKTKKFSLGLTSVIGWDRLVEEAKKCVLLCSNCHMEVEDSLG